MEATLQEILNARERRVNKQQELLNTYQKPLICFTMNIPGPVKDRPEYRKALETGFHRLKAMLQKETFLHEETRMLPTGPEG